MQSSNKLTIDLSDANKGSVSNLINATPTSGTLTPSNGMNNATQNAAMKFQKRFALNSESSVEEFKKFRAAMKHPASILSIDVNSTVKQNSMGPNPFNALCDEILNNMAEIHTSVVEMGAWKTAFVSQPVPSNVKLNFAAMFSRLFRRYETELMIVCINNYVV